MIVIALNINLAQDIFAKDNFEYAVKNCHLSFLNDKL